MQEIPREIGGIGKIVEFDESLLCKRKFNHGRILRGQKWIVVGVERGARHNFFIEHVEKRNRRTLIPLLMRRILPGTTIMTDNWGAYRRLCRYTSAMEYAHFTVNHVTNFVDPITHGIRKVLKVLIPLLSGF